MVGVHKFGVPFPVRLQRVDLPVLDLGLLRNANQDGAELAHLGSDGVVDSKPTVTDGGVLPLRLLVGEAAVDGIGFDGFRGGTDGHDGCGLAL